MSFLFGVRARLTALGVIVAALAAAGIAYASIPDSEGVIHACYTKSGGSLRVIDASVTNCKSGETSLTWNQSGSAGATGPTGPTGAAGPTEGVAATPLFSPPMTPTSQLPSDASMASTFTTTISGKLHLAKPVHATVDCQSAPFVWWWIILDGVAVSSSFARADRAQIVPRRSSA